MVNLDPNVLLALIVLAGCAQEPAAWSGRIVDDAPVCMRSLRQDPALPIFSQARTRFSRR
jgi:hypothetical protein